MKKSIKFFHGGGSKEDFDADKKLVSSLEFQLGPGYSVHYPVLPNDGSPDLGRRRQISHEISTSSDGIILVGHSLGASMLLACLSEMEVKKEISGVFLLAAPFWDGDEDWVEAFKLQPDFANNLDRKIPLFFYQCRDDEEVPFAHLTIYKKNLPWASFREISTGDHQFDNDLTIVANDIKSLSKMI